MRRRDFIRLTTGAVVAAGGILRGFQALHAERGLGQSPVPDRNEHQSSAANNGRRSHSKGQDIASADQLSRLTAWYTAMDSTDGKVVDLFEDDISYLMANNAVWGGTGLRTFSYGGPHNVKNSFVKGWNSSSQYMRWNINSRVAATYRINALIRQHKGVTVRVQVGANALDKPLLSDSLDKVDLGQIRIPQGNSALTISVPATEFDMTLFSPELYPVAAEAGIRDRIANTRSRATWMSHAPMGMMYQWGQWGGNAEGQGTSWPTCYAKVNYPRFAQRLKDEGADFLVWSITYSEYYVAAPISAVDNVLKGRTCQTDYLGALLTECQKRGIKVIFYYHAGHDPNPNSDWWNAFWTAPLAANGVYARKESPMHKVINIFTEIGQRYGTKLAGWMLDDAGVYYPAPFGMLSDALKAGNPDRIVSFNSAYLFDFAPRMTDYEDYYFGETPKGSSPMSWPTDAEGIYTEGPFMGEHAFANFQTESGNWGYFNDASGATIGMRPDHSLNTAMTADKFGTIAVNARDTHAMAAYDFRMYADGTQSPTSLERFKAAAVSAHASS